MMPNGFADRRVCRCFVSGIAIEGAPVDLHSLDGRLAPLEGSEDNLCRWTARSTTPSRCQVRAALSRGFLDGGAWSTGNLVEPESLAGMTGHQRLSVLDQEPPMSRAEEFLKNEVEIWQSTRSASSSKTFAMLLASNRVRVTTSGGLSRFKKWCRKRDSNSRPPHYE